MTPTSAPERMNEPILAAVENSLRSFGYAYSVHGDGAEVRFGCRTRHRTWRSQFLLDPSARLLRLYVFLSDDMYPENLKHQMGELAIRISDLLVIGSVGMEWEGGAVYYRSSLDLRGSEDLNGDVDRLLNTAAYPLDAWEIAFDYLVHRGRSPAQAAEAVLVGLDLAEEDQACPDRRALLSLT
jgi:hypothetical protein